MIKAILLDLDNTLLLNEDIVFARRFLQLLDDYFQKHADTENMSVRLRRAIRQLQTERDSLQSNADIILKVLSEDTGLSSDTIEEQMAGFYQDAYPELQACVGTSAAAGELLETLFKLDCDIVIATNPLYPVQAIQQRMTWADLPADESHYALITGADNMHFVKPDAAYYGEILARAGVEPDEALMIGDSLQNDIFPAAKIGIQTWYLKENAHADYNGSLSEFLAWLKTNNWQNTTIRHRQQPEAIAPQYQGNLAAMTALLKDIPESDWQRRPDPDEWSILQILCHLLDSETRVQYARLEKILKEDNPFIIAPPPPGPDIPICDENIYVVAEKFRAARLKTMALLAKLNTGDWQRPARHSIFGNTSLMEMAYFTAQHDRLHLKQLCQTIGRCQQDV